MSADLSYLVSFQNTEEDVVELISSDLLVHFSNSSIENCLVTINDQSIGALLMNPVGNILWLSHKSIMPCTITSQFSSCTTMEAKFRLFVEPIQQQDKFYYLAPILGENRSLIAVVVFVSDEANSTILLALAHSVGREISEKIKHYRHLQDLVFNTNTHTRMEHRELSIQEVEKSAIIEAARVCRGKIQDMYQVLNMGRTTLWRKLKQYDIDIKDYK